MSCDDRAKRHQAVSIISYILVFLLMLLAGLPLSANAHEEDMHPEIDAQARIDLFVIIDVSITVTRDRSDLLQRIVASLLDEAYFEPGDRICIVLVAGEANVWCPLIPLAAQNLSSGLTTEKDRLLEQLRNGGFSKLEPSLTDLTEAFDELRKECAQRPVTSRTRNRAILLISDGNNDIPPPQGGSPPEIIEDKQNLETAIDEALQTNTGENIPFFMFHLSSLYKRFWRDDARQYGTTRCSGLYREILDENIVSRAVQEMFEFLRQSHRIAITYRISGGSEIFNPNFEINLIEINVQCDSTMDKDILVTYYIEEKGRNLNPILAKPAHLMIYANRRSSYTIPIPIEGIVEEGATYMFDIEFNPERGYEYMDGLLFQEDEPIEAKVSSESAITFSPVKGPIIFRPKILSEDKILKVTLRSTIASDANPAEVSFWTDGHLPEITEPSERDLVLKRSRKLVPFVFNSRESEPGVYRGSINFYSRHGYKITEHGKGASKNSLSLHFYIPETKFIIFFALWVLSIISLFIIAILYLVHRIIQSSNGDLRKTEKGDEIVVDSVAGPGASVGRKGKSGFLRCVHTFFTEAIIIRGHKIPHYIYSVAIMFLTLIVTSFIWRNCLPRSWDLFSMVFLSLTIGLVIFITVWISRNREKSSVITVYLQLTALVLDIIRNFII